MRRLVFAAVGCLAVASATPVRAADSGVPTGTWRGAVFSRYRVSFDNGDGSTTNVFVDGTGPMLFESIAGAVQGEFQLHADVRGVLGGGGVQAAITGAVDAAGKLGGGAGSIAMTEVTGQAVVGITVPFSNGTGTLLLDDIGCVLVGGRFQYDPGALGLISAAGGRTTFFEGRWTAAMEGGVEVSEEQRIVEDLVNRFGLVTAQVGSGEGPIDRPAIVALLGEAERRVAGLSAEAACGLEWTTPLAEATLALLTVALDRAPELTALDLEFLTEAALRTGGIPTVDGALEGRLVDALGVKLDAAIAAGSAAEIDAVFITASILGERDLGARALAARGAL
jgi:hypothetical protein